jgi:hypothetical protein
VRLPDLPVWAEMTPGIPLSATPEQGHRKLSDLRALSRFLHARLVENRKCLLSEGAGHEQVPQPRRPTGDPQPQAPLNPPTGRQDRKTLRTTTGPNLDVGPQQDPNATPAAICPVGGFDKHSPVLMDFAKRSKENFALVAMFAPLSAMAPMHFYVVHFPIIAYVLQKYFATGRVTPEEIGGIVTWLTDRLFPPGAKRAAKPAGERRVADSGWKLTATINGAKFRAIADIWNHRQQLYDQYMSALGAIQQATGRTTAAEPGAGETPLGTDARGRLFEILDGLFLTYSGIAGTGVAKAGFMVQLLTGGLGCIDVHNRQIYDRLADHLLRTGKRGEGRRLHGYLQRLGRLNREEYKDAVSIISTYGFGSRELWNTWVDFAASLWDVIAHRDPIYARIDRVLRTSDFPWHLLQGLRVTKAIPPGNEPWNTLGAGGQPLKQGQTFELPPVSGTRSGDALSSLHLAPVVSGGISDDPATWRRLQALAARNFDPRGSMAQLGQQMPYRYIQAAQTMPSMAKLRQYYRDRRRQREAEVRARDARRAYQAAQLRGEAVAPVFKSWLRLRERSVGGGSNGGVPGWGFQAPARSAGRR